MLLPIVVMTYAPDRCKTVPIWLGGVSVIVQVRLPCAVRSCELTQSADGCRLLASPCEEAQVTVQCIIRHNIIARSTKL
jgi:hypothetical protein